MKVLLGNSPVLGRENCLLARSSQTLTLHVVMGLDEALIKDVAAEYEDSPTRELGYNELEGLQK